MIIHNHDFMVMVNTNLSAFLAHCCSHSDEMYSTNSSLHAAFAESAASSVCTASCILLRLRSLLLWRNKSLLEPSSRAALLSVAAPPITSHLIAPGCCCFLGSVPGVILVVFDEPAKCVSPKGYSNAYNTLSIVCKLYATMLALDGLHIRILHQSSEDLNINIS
jgi:hypothetical protein